MKSQYRTGGGLVRGSWCGSELSADRYDAIGHGTGDQLLVIGRGQCRDGGGGGRDFNRDGRRGHVIQRAQWSAEGAHCNLQLTEFGGDAGGGGLAERHGRGLGLGPGTKGTAIVVSAVGQ